MLVAIRDPLYCPEIRCFCSDQALILVDTNNHTKLYYTCDSDSPCGYFILVRDLQLCDDCDVYYHKQCTNPNCSSSITWKYNAVDNYICA